MSNQEEIVSRANQINQGLYYVAENLPKDLETIQQNVSQVRQQLQQLREDSLSLQNNLSNTMSQFAEKAGQGAGGIYGLLGSNNQLKYDIMQKQSSLDASCVNILDVTNNIFTMIDQTQNFIQQTIEHSTRDLTTLEMELDQVTYLMTEQQNPPNADMIERTENLRHVLESEPPLMGPIQQQAELEQPVIALLKDTMNALNQLDQQLQQQQLQE